MKPKYYVYYVEDCSNILRLFKTKNARTQFINSFLRKYGTENDSNWIDLAFDGIIHYDGQLHKFIE